MRGHNWLGRVYGQTACVYFRSFLFHEWHGKLYGDLGSLELTVLHSDSQIVKLNSANIKTTQP